MILITGKGNSTMSSLVHFHHFQAQTNVEYSLLNTAWCCTKAEQTARVPWRPYEFTRFMHMLLRARGDLETDPLSRTLLSWAINSFANFTTEELPKADVRQFPSLLHKGSQLRCTCNAKGACIRHPTSRRTVVSPTQLVFNGTWVVKLCLHIYIVCFEYHSPDTYNGEWNGFPVPSIVKIVVFQKHKPLHFNDGIINLITVGWTWYLSNFLRILTVLHTSPILIGLIVER